MLMNVSLVFGFLLFAGLIEAQTGAAADTETWDGKIVQYGKMHEVIGQQQHQERVQLRKVIEQPHFYGVAALTRLEGEATILNGKATVTRVNANGQLEASESAALDDSTTLLVGAYVPSWSVHKVARTVNPDELDKYLAAEATKTGVEASEPFVFTMEGEFSNVHIHVIHGACPLHARLAGIRQGVYLRLPHYQPFFLPCYATENALSRRVPVYGH